MSSESHFDDRLVVSQISYITDRSEFSLRSFSKLITPGAELSYFPLDEPAYSLTLLEVQTSNSENAIIRGNHYHKLKKEYLYVFDGAMVGKFMDIKTGFSVALDLKIGDLVFIDINIAHALCIKKTVSFLEYSPTKLDSWDSYSYDVAECESDFS